MYQKDDYVVYKRNVCKIKDINKNSFSNKDYYILIPIDDNSLTINIPVENSEKLLRDIIKKEQAETLIKSIPNIKVINSNDKLLEVEYKNLMHSENLEDLITIIKTTYLRNDMRLKTGKKIAEKDNEYFNRAEKYLYNELSISLNMTYNEVKEYIKTTVEKLEK